VKPDDTVYTIVWHVNPFRGDKFEEAWRPAAEAAIDFGATFWAFWRSKDDALNFTQLAVFRSKLDFERYWFSEQLAEARAECAGLFQVPVTPSTFRVVDGGELQPLEELERA
jgi:hypothetical protein